MLSTHEILYCVDESSRKVVYTMPRQQLSESEIAERLPGVPEWRLENARLFRSFHFTNFSEAFAFMTRVALLAERLDHHPEWSNVWSRVDIALTTHDAGGISERDFDLARQIDNLLEHGS